ncbi:Zinc carboxypeptidase [Botrimarina hoheduenensis]|uniref:Zinc carboxypeptidase n=1 Tax=Botrimarina hoheduenensis TaxID=2528000 RepID=A0A5C5WBI4_9BACT|nr:Zinc carboxypeptidase [Botrimarina hoheduenensis]
MGLSELIATRVTLVLLAISLPASLRAQITLDADFDSGSLDEAGSAVIGNLVQLAGRDNYNPGNWKWTYFSADGVLNATPTFRIDDEFETGGSNLNTHAMVYSYDQENWNFFDNNSRNATANTFTFFNDTAFTSDRVWVAYGLPYPVARSVAHTASIATSPWVSPTASANSQLVIGQSPGGVDDLGRVIPQQDLFGYRITDPAATGLKAKVVLLGGVHANETLGNHTLEAMVDYLLSDDLGAAILRRRADFYVYPMANPDGRLAGYNRGTVEDVNRDPNRSWDPPLYDGQPEIAIVGEAMKTDTASDVDFFIDFHSTVQKGPGHFGFIDIDRGFHLNPFWTRLQQLEPTLQTFDADLIDDTGAKFGLFELNAGFTMTFETRFIAGENEDRFVTLGTNFGRALADTLATPTGDLNFDGQVDGADWLILSANAETDLSAFTPFDAYARGDLDLNGANDVEDFILFKDLYIATNGQAAFALLVAGVPEPATAVMLAPLLFFFRIHRRCVLRPFGEYPR